jgi:hypothetical protein
MTNTIHSNLSIHLIKKSIILYKTLEMIKNEVSTNRLYTGIIRVIDQKLYSKTFGTLKKPLALEGESSNISWRGKEDSC